MPMSNLERSVRFSDYTMEALHTIYQDCMREFSDGVLESSVGMAMMESKTNHVKSKKEMLAEADRLSKSDSKDVKELGVVAKGFLNGVKTFDEVLIVITALLLLGGAALATAIAFILDLVVFAVFTGPQALILTGLAKQRSKIETTLGADAKKDKNVRKYIMLVDDIQEHGPTKDVAKINKRVHAIESVCQILESYDGYKWENDKELDKYHNMVSVMKAIDIKRGLQDNGKYSKDIEIGVWCTESLAPSDLTAGVIDKLGVVPRFGNNDGTISFSRFEQIVSKPMLSGQDLVYGLICIATELCDQESALRFMKAFKNTVKYEFTHDAYKDVPIITITGKAFEYIKECCCDVPDVIANVNDLDSMFAEVVDDAYDEIREDAVVPSTSPSGFNPDPFDVYNLTPFPVAARKVQQSLDLINDANTDDEICEALIEFERVSRAINEQYYVEEGYDGTIFVVEADVGKAARKIETKANQKFSKAAVKDKTKGVKAAVKHTLSPMEKFINEQYKKIRDADREERREVILKGGAIPKITRWLKRSIPIAATGGTGAAVGAIAAGAAAPYAAIAAAIAFLGFVASDKYLDKRERKKILQELEDEIQVCNEKIDDSRGDDNKQNKYQLMRIRNDLVRTQEKVKLGLAY